MNSQKIAGDVKGYAKVGQDLGGNFNDTTMSSLKSYYPVDLVELYNDGVDHVMRQIWETDATGRKTTSRTVIPGSHYMEQAIINFMGNYAYEYNVISVERI